MKKAWDWNEETGSHEFGIGNSGHRPERAMLATMINTDPLDLDIPSGHKRGPASRYCDFGKVDGYLLSLILLRGQKYALMQRRESCGIRTPGRDPIMEAGNISVWTP